jgi:hypothetical protein
MNRYSLPLACVAAFLLAAAPAHAAWTQEARAMRAGQQTVFASCAATTAHKAVPNVDPYLSFTYDVTIKGWSGNCVGGKRDGVGLFTLDFGLNYPLIPPSTAWGEVWEGAMTGGNQVGLWCSTYLPNALSYFSWHTQPECRLLNGAQSTDLYVKQVDGRWKQVDILGAVSDQGALDAGSLEAESGRLIAAAQAGQPAAQIQLGTRIAELSDLVRGGSILQVYDNKPLGLAGKRVAIVFSTSTLGEIARYRKMYASLKAKGSSDQPSRQDALAFAVPESLMRAITSGVRHRAATVLAAGDLSVLNDGKADYALVVDWRFKGKIDMAKGEYVSTPPCTGPQLEADKCQMLYQQIFTAYLVSPALKSVRRVTVPAEGSLIHVYPRQPQQSDEDYYDDFFIELDGYNRRSWAQDTGAFASALDSALSD